MKKIVTVLCFIALAVSCKKTAEEPDADTLVNPNDPDAISQVLVIPNSQVRSGALPISTGTAQSPVVSLSSQNSYTTSNGSTLPITFLYSNLTTTLGGIYLKVDGAADYRDIQSTATSANSGSISMNIGVPQNVDSGFFNITFCIYDAANRVSNVIKRGIEVVRLGTGSIQINLAWDTDNTDVDLHLTEPGGNEIYYANESSTSGGFLDRDDVDGFGPENIYFQNSMPDGRYTVSLVYYAAHGVPAPANCVITINSPGKSKTFTKTLTIANPSTKFTITDIEKSGDSYEY